LQGSADILRLIPMATRITQDYYCTGQYLKFNQKSARKYIIAVQNR